MFRTHGFVKGIYVSRIFEALQQANPEVNRLIGGEDEYPEGSSRLVAALSGEHDALEDVPGFALPQSPSSRLVVWKDPNSLAAENFRVVSSRLRSARQRRDLKILLVTSAVRGDGKSVTSANLAITLAMHGEKTLLIDGDLHRPTLAKSLMVEDGGGFVSWHSGKGRVVDLLHRADSLPLWFLPSGVCHSQPVTLIQSEKTTELLKQVRAWFSWVVIDSPPLVPLADANIWANVSDGTFLVARQGLTPRKPLEKAIASMDQSKLLGIILNDAQSNEERYYRAYYAATKPR